MKKKKATVNRKDFFTKNTHLLLILLLSISVIIIYARTSNFEFVNIDDNSLIIENPTVVNPDIPYSDCFKRMIGGVHYKPLVFLSWKLEYNLWGNSPWHFHTINWILHLLNTILLFYILIRLFSHLYDSYKKTLFSAFFVTLLFTVNPLRIESVAWATERKDVLFGFFFLAGWLLYLNYLDKKNYLFLILGAVFYLLSGLSKSMGLTLLAVVLLCDLWFERKINLKLFFEKIPFLIVLLLLMHLYGLLEFNTTPSTAPQTVESDLVESNMETITSVESLKDLPDMVQWFLTTSARFLLWIVHSFIPVKLSIHYSHNGVYAFLGKSIYLLPIIALGMFFLAWRYRSSNKSVFAGLLFFAATISPALFLNTSGQGVFLSDRYTYIPSIGLFFLMITVLNQMKSKQTTNLFLGAFIAFFFIQSLLNVNHWKNSGNLFVQALKVYPDSGFAHLNLGKYYYEQDNLPEAIKMYNRGINRAPGYYKLYSNRGKIYFDQGQTENAINDFNQCLSLKPDYVTALANRGAAYGSKQEYDKALIDLNKALEISPNDENALSNRGLLYLFTKEFDKAVVDYSRYVELYPDDADI
ncbi:MAG: tetratricopeptide repeat protein, partial [Bacteroidota bacterium]